MDFTVIGEIEDIETFATGQGIRELRRLRRKHGRGRWRKRKGVAMIRLSDGFLSVLPAQAPKFANALASGECLDVVDLADDREVHA